MKVNLQLDNFTFGFKGVKQMQMCDYKDSIGIINYISMYKPC